MRSVRHFAAGALVLALGGAPARAQEASPEAPPAVAQPDTKEIARKYYDEGAAAYERKDYEAALRSFHAAYSTLPSPEFQFNISRCWERLGKWDFAAAALERYLGGKPDVADAADLRLHVLE